MASIVSSALHSYHFFLLLLRCIRAFVFLTCAAPISLPTQVEVRGSADDVKLRANKR